MTYELDSSWMRDLRRLLRLQSLIIFWKKLWDRFEKQAPKFKIGETITIKRPQGYR